MGSSELPRTHRDVCWPPRYLLLLSSLDLAHESTELFGVSFGRGTMNLLLRQSGRPGRRKFGNVCCESEGEIRKHREGGCGWKLPEGGVRDGDGVAGQLARHTDRRAGQGERPGAGSGEVLRGSATTRVSSHVLSDFISVFPIFL